MSGLATWSTLFVAVSLGLHLWSTEGAPKGLLLGEALVPKPKLRDSRAYVAGVSLMVLLCLANTPLPAPWVQWLDGEPVGLPVRLQTPYVEASGPVPGGDFVPPAATASAAAVSATSLAVSDELQHSGAAAGDGSVPEGGGAAALPQAGAGAAGAAAAGAARNASGSAGSTGLGAAAAAAAAALRDDSFENVRDPTLACPAPRPPCVLDNPSTCDPPPHPLPHPLLHPPPHPPPSPPPSPSPSFSPNLSASPSRCSGSRSRLRTGTPPQPPPRRRRRARRSRARRPGVSGAT